MFRNAHPSTMTAEQIDSLRLSFVGAGSAEKPVIRQEVTGGVVFTSDHTNREGVTRFCATGFAGKAIKPAFHFSFRTVERRAEYVAEWVKKNDQKAAAKKERADERKNSKHALVKGTVLVSIWGYEQTNVDYYVVTNVVSDKMVDIAKIASNLDTDAGHGPMSGTRTPDPLKITGQPMRKRATADGIRLSSYSSAHVWEGRPVHCSWYA